MPRLLKILSKRIALSVRFPYKVVFTNRNIMDLVYLGGARALNGVDRGTKILSARFFPKFTTIIIWDSFFTIWFNMYTAYPQHILTDQDSVSNSADGHSAAAKVLSNILNLILNLTIRSNNMKLTIQCYAAFFCQIRATSPIF